MSPAHPESPSADPYCGVGVLQNLSIVSHTTAFGSGAFGVDPNLSSVAETAQSFTDRARSELPGAAFAPKGPSARKAPAAEPPAPAKDVTHLELVRSFVVTGFPLTLASMAQFSINLVTIAIIGKLLGVDEMGGATLALSLVNATGFAVGTGLCGALETVLSHAYGDWEKQQQLTAKGDASSSAPSDTEPDAMRGDKGKEALRLYIYGTYAQRMTLILLLAAFPLGIILCFVDRVLQLFEDSPSTLYYMASWCTIVIFGLPVTLLIPLIQRYYSCQRVTKPLLVALFLAAAVNPGLQVGFIKLMGYKGSTVAWMLLMLGLLLGIILHIRWTGLYRLTWGGWNQQSIQNLGPLTRLALPSLGMMMCEWVAVEVVALIAGSAPSNDLAAFSISLNIFGLLWGVTSGVIIITSVFVGNAIGGRKPLFARRIALISIVLVFCISCIDVLLILLLNPYIPSFFTNEPKVVVIYQKIMRSALPYHIVDTLQSTMMAILRGCGLQSLGAIIISIALCVVGVPLSCILFFHFKLGVVSLWVGLLIGVGGVGVPLYLYVIFRYIDWKSLKPHNDDSIHL